MVCRSDHVRRTGHCARSKHNARYADKKAGSPSERRVRARLAAAAALECGGLPPLSFRLTGEFRADGMNHRCRRLRLGGCSSPSGPKAAASRRTPKRASHATSASRAARATPTRPRQPAAPEPTRHGSFPVSSLRRAARRLSEREPRDRVRHRDRPRHRC
jgi:hypothetical protein